MPRLKIIAVDQAVMYRTILRRAIETTGLAKLVRVSPSNDLAIERIKYQDYDLVITGGVECMIEKNGGYMRCFDVLATLTRTEDGRPMPFSNKRCGFLFAEGAGCILILEELELAKKRGATIYAEIIDYNANSDAYNIVQIEPSGNQIKKLLKGIIGNRKIDY